jgi:cyanophycinase
VSTAAHAAENILGMPPKSLETKGALVICGGGPTPDAVCDEFIRLAGGKKARIVLIPSAYSYSSMAYIQQRFKGWREYSVASFIILDAHSRAEANATRFVGTLEKATGVWIPGGSQGRLAEIYGGTKSETAIRGVVERGGVVGGTSAGAAVMSQVMIRYGNSSAVVTSRGFGLLSGAVVDQHFSQRGRHARLLDVLEDNPGLLGLGVDERTGLIVQGNHLRVIGDSRVTVYIPSEARRASLVYRMKPGDQADLTMANERAKDIQSRVDLTKVQR